LRASDLDAVTICPELTVDSVAIAAEAAVAEGHRLIQQESNAALMAKFGQFIHQLAISGISRAGVDSMLQRAEHDVQRLGLNWGRSVQELSVKG